MLTIRNTILIMFIWCFFKVSTIFEELRHPCKLIVKTTNLNVEVFDLSNKKLLRASYSSLTLQGYISSHLVFNNYINNYWSLSVFVKTRIFVNFSTVFLTPAVNHPRRRVIKFIGLTLEKPWHNIQCTVFH